MPSSQPSSSTLQESFTDAFTESSSPSIGNPPEPSSSLEYIGSRKHLVQYPHHDDPAKEEELQSQFKEWWSFTEVGRKNSDQSQSSGGKLT